MYLATDNSTRPIVQLVGEINHSDFRDAVSLLQADCELVGQTVSSPELIVAAQARPGTICRHEIERLRRQAPLAGAVALLGSWCEGETRTGRPWPGVERQYWYEFPAWWRRQMALRATGRCPDWARPPDFGFRIADFGLRTELCRKSGLIILRIARRETADALADVFHRAGYATAWQPPGTSAVRVRGAVAGIWEGGQLDDSESADLAAFCRQIAGDRAPVVALLDFPRRDRVARALEIGAASVLGKPWLNTDLLATLQTLANKTDLARAA